jgi:hypothetical protein
MNTKSTFVIHTNKFLFYILKKLDGKVIFYTDASFNTETKTADFGVFYPHENYRFYQSLPNGLKGFIEGEYMHYERTSIIIKNRFKSLKKEDIIVVIYNNCKMIVIK